MFQNLVGERGIFLAKYPGRPDGAGEHLSRRGAVVFQDEFFSIRLVDYSLSNRLSGWDRGDKPWFPNNIPAAVVHGRRATSRLRR